MSRGSTDQFAGKVRPVGEIVSNVQTVQDAIDTGTIVKQNQDRP
jgi:hypothetical protein